MLGLRDVHVVVSQALHPDITRLTRSSPFAAAQTQAELIQMVKGGKMPPVPVSYSPQLRGIIRAMMSLNVRTSGIALRRADVVAQITA
jgi:hypothetical protein